MKENVLNVQVTQEIFQMTVNVIIILEKRVIRNAQVKFKLINKYFDEKHFFNKYYFRNIF
jgi:hypothetical protein